MKRKSKILSILVIPEGEGQTFSIKIRYGILKLLAVVVIFFCIVLTVGAFSYWHFVKLSWDYNQLAAKNQTLLEQNAIINEVVQKFINIQEIDKRIRNIFGDIDFPDDDPISSLGQITQNRNSKYATPLSSEGLNRILNPFLQADILSSYPTLMPIKGKITQGFSLMDAVTGIGHFGVDLTAKEGSVVSAAGDGIVIFANWTTKDGNQVIIDHQNGYISIYKHNASIIVQEREFVYQGEPITLLGNSGISSAPHLHFEIWKNYVPIDPLTLWSTN